MYSYHPRVAVHNIVSSFTYVSISSMSVGVIYVHEFDSDF